MVVDALDEIGLALSVALLIGLGVLSLLWLRRTIVKERRFVEELMPDTVQASSQLLNRHQQTQGRAEVTFLLNKAGSK